MRSCRRRRWADGRAWRAGSHLELSPIVGMIKGGGRSRSRTSFAAFSICATRRGRRRGRAETRSRALTLVVRSIIMGGAR